MAYYTGSAANVAAVLTALTNAVAEGLDMERRHIVQGRSRHIRAVGCGDTASDTLCGGGTHTSGDTYVDVCHQEAITYPGNVSYSCSRPKVFMVINYRTKFQWLAFGQISRGSSGQLGRCDMRISYGGQRDMAGRLNLMAAI